MQHLLRMYFGKTILFGFEASVLIEVIQLFSKVGSFDVDDLLLNTIGGCLGYLLCYFLVKRKHTKKVE